MNCVLTVSSVIQNGAEQALVAISRLPEEMTGITGAHLIWDIGNLKAISRIVQISNQIM